MAAPAKEASMDDLTGKWSLNRKLSDPFEPLLTLQGVPWVVRKAVNHISISEILTHSTDPSTGLTTFEITQITTGGFKGTCEKRTLNGEERTYNNELFGPMGETCVWFDLPGAGSKDNADGSQNEKVVSSDRDEDEKWLMNGLEGSKAIKIETWSLKEDKDWRTVAMWGFATIESGERYHVRKLVARNKGEVVRIRGVYNYVGMV